MSNQLLSFRKITAVVLWLIKLEWRLEDMGLPQGLGSLFQRCCFLECSRSKEWPQVSLYHFGLLIMWLHNLPSLPLSCLRPKCLTSLYTAVLHSHLEENTCSLAVSSQDLSPLGAGSLTPLVVRMPAANTGLGFMNQLKYHNSENEKIQQNMSPMGASLFITIFKDSKVSWQWLKTFFSGSDC